VLALPDLTLAELFDAVNHELKNQLSPAGQLRRRVHQNPEISWLEHETSAAVSGALEGMVLEPIAETGLLVHVGDADLPAIGIRAELDGLPIIEGTDVEFASTNGAMHACGHDVHMAALVALLRAFEKVCQTGRPPVSLLGVFQPSEESNPSGAQRIVESGRLRDHRLAAMLALHVHPRVAWGSVATGEGAVNACSDSFTLTVTGVGGHSAYPHHGHDPVLALSQVVVALQQIVSRRVDPMHPAVISVTRLEAGSVANVIPAEAIAEGTVRVLDPTDRASVLELVESIAVNTAAAYGCRVRVEVQHGDPVLVNDPRLATAVDAGLGRTGIEVAEPMRSCGADDFAFYGAVCPSLMMFLGVEDHCGQPATESDANNLGIDHSVAGAGRSPGLHHPNFLPSEETVARAARVMLTAFIAAAETVFEPREGN